jgi:hypothetical protein
MVLDQIAGTGKVAYKIDDGVIVISTADDLALNFVTRVYDVRDVLPSGDKGAEMTEDDPHAQALCRLITEAITPARNPATTRPSGWVQFLRGQIIVTTTPENQTKVERILDDLHQLTAPTTRPSL